MLNKEGCKPCADIRTPPIAWVGLARGLFYPRCIPKTKGEFVLPVEPTTKACHPCNPTKELSRPLELRASAIRAARLVRCTSHEQDTSFLHLDRCVGSGDDQQGCWTRQRYARKRCPLGTRDWRGATRDGDGER
jgi:hypothetical protein